MAERSSQVDAALPAATVGEAAHACPDGPSRLAALRQVGVHRLDPVRWVYLESLARRVPAAPAPVARLLSARLTQALQASEDRWLPNKPVDDAARNAALPASPAAAQVETGPVAGGLSDEARTVEPGGPVKAFAAVFARRRAGLARQPAQQPQAVTARSAVQALTALNAYIAQATRPRADALARSGLAGDHDGAPNARSGAMTATMDLPTASAAASAATREVVAGLKSARHMGDAYARLQSARRAEQAVRHAPENAGPFNPHRLMARALVAMQDLSPAYLHRFVQRVDVLLQLEHAAARQNVPTRKPKTTRKSVPGQTSGTVS